MSPMDAEGRIRPYLWFTLYELMRLGALRGFTRVSTTGLARRINCSQQSASRHLRLLEGLGLVRRRIEADGSLVRITGDGRRALEEVSATLRTCLEGGGPGIFELEGVVFSGMFQGGYYISQEGYGSQIREKLGFDPFPGTLNLKLREADMERRRELDGLPGVRIDGFRGEERAFGGARCYPLVVNGDAEGAMIVADRTGYDLSVVEVIAPVNLRERFGLEDGDVVKLEIRASRSTP